MPLLSLPPEIIRMIAWKLPYFGDMFELACTNRFLHDLLIRDIYKGNLDCDPYNTALIWYAMNGAIKGMHHLLFWKADLNTHLSLYKEENGRITRSQTTSALHLAVEDDNLTMAKLLLRHGADPNAEFTDCTPLDVAVGRGNGVMTLLLLENGAKTRDEITLSRAIEHGGTMAWVKAGRCGEDYPFSEPEVAPNYDFHAVVLVLHLYGADLNQNSLLYDAVEHYGSPDDGVIELLLYLGADVHAKDERGGSVISRAFEGAYRDARRSKAFAQLLIAYGAEVKPEDLRNPLESAIYRGDIEDLELVLEYGGDVNSTCCEGPFLHLVITRDFFDDDTTQEGLLKLLLNWGADVLARDRDSRTPLEHAMLFPWKINLAKPLLDASAKVQCHGKEGAQLLTYLIKDGLTSYFEEDTSTDSLRYEFQVRSTDSFRYKLQDYLEDMNEGRLRDPYDFSEMDAMIGLLLEYGVCPDYADDSGQCPLDLPGATLFSALQPWLSKRRKT